jgi:hypothetical protein
MSILKFPERPRPMGPPDSEWMYDTPEQIALLEKALHGEGDTVQVFVANEILSRLYIPGPDNETVGDMKERAATNFFVLCKMLRKWRASENGEPRR